MAQSGQWLPNLFDWLVGFILIMFWLTFRPFFSLLGWWQIPLDSMIAIYDQFAPSDVSDIYLGYLSIGGQVKY